MEYFGIRQNYTTPCMLLTPRIWPCTTFHNDCSYRNFQLLEHHGFLNSVHYHLTLLFAICFDVGLPLPITCDHPITAVTAILWAYLYFSLIFTVRSSSSFTSRIFS